MPAGLATFLAILALAGLSGPCLAEAHERSVSYLEIATDPGGADLALRIDGRDLTRPRPAAAAAGSQEGILRAVASALTLRRGGGPCDIEAGPVAAPSAEGRRVLRWRLACPDSGSLEVDSDLPGLLRTPHLCFVRLRGTAEGEFVLHTERRLWRQADAAGSGASRTPPGGPSDMVRLGVEHIAGGWDHLLFVVGLVVVAVSLSEVVVVVTAFTVAHMTTLALAALELVAPAAAPVEALIALSIALLAVENLTFRGPGAASRVQPALRSLGLVLAPALVAALAGLGRVGLAPLAGTALFAAAYFVLASRRPDDRRLRWLVAFVFGLLHGLGFAGALFETGWSDQAVTVALLAFNAGVEIGQLLFVVLLWTLLGLLGVRADKQGRRLLVEPVSVLMLAAAAAWYTTRTFG